MNANVVPMRHYLANRSGMAMANTQRLPDVISQSPQMERVFRCLERVAGHFRTALVTGETGTGKEAISRALHDMSPATGRLVVLNCSAVVETLFESELFGHVRGAFTGADRDKVGQCEYANGGTLLLDEIGDMPLSTQAKLLRVLQNQEVQRVGSLVSKKVDIRVVSATNRDLKAAVRKKQFREDLYYRLCMVEIHLPPLRDRVGDLPLLIEHFLSQWSTRYGKTLPRLTPAAFCLLESHDWPGNIRELENVLGYACMMTTRDTIDVEDLPPYLADPAVALRVPGFPVVHSDAEKPVREGLLEECESRLIRRALDQANWNESKAARALGTTRDRIRYRVKKYQLVKSFAPGEDIAYG